MMIAVAELLTDKYIPANYFAPDAYVQGDIEAGLIENRSGARLLALPSTLLEAIYAGLEEEVGPASTMVMFSCGRWWGKNFYRRFGEEVSQYYGRSLAEIEMVELVQCLKQCWKAHGWGTFELDLNYHQQGFLVIHTQHSAFAQAAPQGNRPNCFAEAGILSAFFSQLTGQNLNCIQIACESLGAEQNSFVLGLHERLMAAEAGVEAREDCETIMQRLCPPPVVDRANGEAE
jgi:predicted hydrocarbon binding protein